MRIHPALVPGAAASLALLLPGCRPPATTSAPGPAAKPPEPVTTRADLKLVQPALRTAPPLPAQPAATRTAGIFGRVVTEVTVDETGLVTQVRALSGPEELRAVTVAWARKLVFSPGSLDGVPKVFRMKAAVLWSAEGRTYEVVLPKSAAGWE